LPAELTVDIRFGLEIEITNTAVTQLPVHAFTRRLQVLAMTTLQVLLAAEQDVVAELVPTGSGSPKSGRLVFASVIGNALKLLLFARSKTDSPSARCNALRTLCYSALLNRAPMVRRCLSCRSILCCIFAAE